MISSRSVRRLWQLLWIASALGFAFNAAALNTTSLRRGATRMLARWISVRDAAERSGRRGSGRHGLDPRRHLHDRHAREFGGRDRADEERHVRHGTHQVLGVPERSPGVRLRDAEDCDDGLHARHRRERSFIHIRGLEIKNVPMNTSSNNGISASGSNNVFELINFHHNSGNGIFINGGNGGNLILNCDAHDNYDATSSQGDGQNADGFGVHYQKSGPSTVVRGCRAWWNSDDGYDLINQEVPVTIENSWAMGNGYIDSGTARPADGNGNGFKAGSSKTGVRHTIQNCLAWGNVASGLLRQSLFRRERLVQQHVVQERHPVQHARERSERLERHHHLDGRQGASDAEQRRLPEQEHQHDGRRYRLQYLGPRASRRQTLTS